jgi:[lysine-biosynthesis-protein LysW]---L-2-aminoadipate ligase
MRIGIVSHDPTPTTLALAETLVPGVTFLPLTPFEAATTLERGDAALGRLDVRETLDGVEDGLWSLGYLGARDVAVLNGPATLIATHDKLVTARLLRRWSLPHPRTCHVRGSRPFAAVSTPVVLKPRHGSWGRHVTLCETEAELTAALDRVRDESWYVEHGALVQDLVPLSDSDLRLVVAGGEVVGAIRRVPAPGEWRTNVALGATRIPVDPPARAVELARVAARAANAALVGVDLLPTGDGGFTILELNGAVDFAPEYFPGGDVYERAAAAIAQVARVEAARVRHSSGPVAA